MKRMMMMAAVLVALTAMVSVVGCDDDGDVSSAGGSGVWVCTGKGATVWHVRRDCGALSNCDGEVIRTTSPGSQYKKACKRCSK